MPIATIPVLIDEHEPVELSMGYDLLGDPGARTWAITPGGRFSRDYPGVRPFAEALAELGNHVLIHDRPNTGESDLCFRGSTESTMQADALAALLRHLDLGPTVVAGGSGGSRVSLLTAARHPDVTSGLAMWWLSGGVFGLLQVGGVYCAAPIRAVWNGGMAAVVDLPTDQHGNFAEQMAKNPTNRQRLLDQDPAEFKATMERWYLAYCPCGDSMVPGITDDDARKVDLPALVFRSGNSDMFHTRETSEAIAHLLPNARLVDSPWPDDVWITSRPGHQFEPWHLLAPHLHDWATATLGDVS